MCVRVCVRRRPLTDTIVTWSLVHRRGLGWWCRHHRPVCSRLHLVAQKSQGHPGDHIGNDGGQDIDLRPGTRRLVTNGCGSEREMGGGGKVMKGGGRVTEQH
jgi:hypothetical protein